MNSEALHIIINLQKNLIGYRYDKGEISGTISCTKKNIDDLKILAEIGVTENFIVLDGKSIPLDKIDDWDKQVPILMFSRNLNDSKYYDNLTEFIKFNQYNITTQPFYIRSLEYLSGNPLHPDLEKVICIQRFITLLQKISDFVVEEVDNTKRLIIFQKRKVEIPVVYILSDLRSIDYLESLQTQLESSHDSEERITIFKTEIVGLLTDIHINQRFARLLAALDTVFDNYLKSHLLYLEKFSYHDLKSEVDSDKLDFTKKIYGTVNDIQTKLIAVPAAFLLVLSQFDFTGEQITKNILICIASVLFSILLEILLLNQFGVLKYIRNEIDNFKNELSNKDIKIDLSEFVRSFSELEPLMQRQKTYLWIFRIIIWLVPVTSVFMLIYFGK